MAGLRRYQRYAEELTALIRSGELPPGARLPSVREASRARRISPATVFEAFYLLQARGLIESRPRSGFFVSKAAPAAPVRAAAGAPRGRPVAVSELVFEVLEATRRPEIVEVRVQGLGRVPVGDFEHDIARRVDIGAGGARGTQVDA